MAADEWLQPHGPTRAAGRQGPQRHAATRCIPGCSPMQSGFNPMQSQACSATIAPGASGACECRGLTDRQLRSVRRSTCDHPPFTCAAACQQPCVHCGGTSTHPGCNHMRPDCNRMHPGAPTSASVQRTTRASRGAPPRAAPPTARGCPPPTRRRALPKHACACACVQVHVHVHVHVACAHTCTRAHMRPHAPPALRR